jgi:tetratricopeptide (TPR) repeat protein
MKRTLLFAALLSFATGSSIQSARSIQDKQLPGDFVNRPGPPISPEAKREMEARLAEARARYEANPKDPDVIIWLGRRLAYLGRFRESIETYTRGIAEFPRDARLYRHRGHRYITLRRFDLAIDDLRKAASLIKGQPDQVEPDGQPNARNVPTGILQFNIWYHLGLAYYLTGKNKLALDSYRACLAVSNNPDSLVATTHWLYMTLRRLNRNREATAVLQPIREGMDIIENDGYYRLVLMYKGLTSADALLAEALKLGSSPGSLSILYGIGNWHLYSGRGDQGIKIFRDMLAGNQWTSFGYIAAEADVARHRAGRRPIVNQTMQGEDLALTVRDFLRRWLIQRDDAGALKYLSAHPLLGSCMTPEYADKKNRVSRKEISEVFQRALRMILNRTPVARGLEALLEPAAVIPMNDENVVFFEHSMPQYFQILRLKPVKDPGDIAYICKFDERRSFRKAVAGSNVHYVFLKLRGQRSAPTLDVVVLWVKEKGGWRILTMSLDDE